MTNQPAMDRAQQIARIATSVTVLLALTACSALPPAGRAARPTPSVSLDLPTATQSRLRDFDLAVQSVREQHIDPGLVNDDWLAEADAFRQQIIDGMDTEAYARGLAQLLEKLNDPAIMLEAPAVAGSGVATTTFSGIGILAGMPRPGKDRLVVLVVYPGSPAERAGLRPHDAILAVDGRRVTYDERQTVLGRIRGPSGTQVTLTVRSPGQRERDVTIRRAPITPTSRPVIRRAPGTNIAWLAAGPGDAETLPIDLARGLRELARERMPDGIILDLRVTQSPAFPLIPMLSLFAHGAVGARHTRSGQQKIDVSGRQIAGSQDLPLVILIGDQTQGPAVSFAAMLQELGRATLVGSKTSPAVAQPVVLNLRETGLQIAIPAIEYRGVKGQALHRTGLTPDEDTGLAWEDFSAEDDPQMARAIALLQR